MLNFYVNLAHIGLKMVQIYQKQGLLRGQRSKITAFSIRWHGFFAKFIVVNSLSKTRLIEQSAQRVC